MAGRTRMRAALRGRAPGLVAERDLWDAGHRVVAGLDEVGRGAWAGPLTVGVVVPARNRRITGVRDSKMLTEPEREALFDRITGWAEAWSVGHASNDECDDLGMSDAQRLAARRALDGLGLADVRGGTRQDHGGSIRSLQALPREPRRRPGPPPPGAPCTTAARPPGTPAASPGRGRPPAAPGGAR